MTRHLLLLSSLLGIVLAGRAAETAEGNDPRLRDALRNATLQLRAAETERTSLQSANTALLAEKKAAEEKFEILRKQTVSDRAAAEKSLTTLQAQIAARDAELAGLKAALAKSQSEHLQAAGLAAARETERAKLAADLVVLERTVADRTAKNLALFRVGSEILTRYENFTMGEALAAREPFVGATRTRLENLVQDYQDKLADQRVKP